MKVADFDGVTGTAPASLPAHPMPGTTEIFRAIYISHTRARLSDAQLDAVMNDLYRTNSALKLSGLLLYKARTFFEVIEGPRDVVIPALDRIFRDPRHYKMKIMMCKPAHQRRFDGWSMGFRRLDGTPSHALCYFNLTRRDLEARFPRGASQEILFFLRSYLTARFPEPPAPDSQVACKVRPGLQA